MPVLLYHLVPMSLQPRRHPPHLKRVRIHQPTKSTRLRSSAHMPEVSVRKGVATTCGDDTSPATADPKNTSPIQHHHLSSHLALCTLCLALALANMYPAQQQQQGMGTSNHSRSKM